MALQYKDANSVYTSTGSKEVALMLRERYDKNRDQADLLQLMMAQLQTRPGDVGLKDQAEEKINAELGNVIETGRYEMATAALGSAQNIFQSDKGLQLANASYKNRQEEVAWINENNKDKTVLDWGGEDYKTGVSYYLDKETNTMVENVYQAQAEIMEDYGAEQRKMLQTISADWTGISQNKADQIAWMLTQTYLSSDNRVGTQQYKYLTQLTGLKDLEDDDKKHEAAVDHVYNQFRSLTHQYIHSKKTEATVNNANSLQTGLEGFFKGSAIDKGNLAFDLNSTVQSAGEYLQNVQNIKYNFDFVEGQSVDLLAYAEANEILKMNDKKALEESGQFSDEEISRHLLLKYGSADNPEYAPLAGLVDYLTAETSGLSWVTGDKFGPLNQGIGETLFDASASGLTAYTGTSVLQGIWNYFGPSKKIKLAKTVGGLIFMGKGGYDVATENLFNHFNNVRDPNWGIGLNEEEKLVRILNDVDWVNEKLGTNYSLNDPTYKQAIINAKGLLAYRMNGGDDMDQITDNYNGAVFEGRKYASSDGADVGKANNVLSQFSITDFRVVGMGDMSKNAWIDYLGLDASEYEDKNIPITFKSFVSGSIQHGIPNSLELEIAGQNVIVRSKGANLPAQDRNVNTIEEQVARQLGIKIFNVEDSAMRMIKQAKQSGAIKANEVTPEIIMNYIAQAYQNEGAIPAGEGGQPMSNEQAILAAQQYIIQTFQKAHPEIYYNFYNQIQKENPTFTQAQVDQTARHLTFITMYDDQYWDVELTKYKTELENLLNTGQITQYEYESRLNQAKQNSKGKSWMKQPITY